ncbi:MAG: hypothetical protein KDA91_14650 [Planctomycetaceae bacterium]|nr:hypothetical protein [Planctomycetaceae bacterium]
MKFSQKAGHGRGNPEIGFLTLSHQDLARIAISCPKTIPACGLSGNVSCLVFLVDPEFAGDRSTTTTPEQLRIGASFEAGL